MLTVDRIEDGIAVCEQDGIVLELPLELISSEVKEGDMLLPLENGSYTVDSAATQERKGKMVARFASLRKKR